MSMIQTPKPEDNTTNNNNNVEATVMPQQQQEHQQQATSCPRNSHTHHQVSNNINVYVQQKQQQPVKHHVHRHNVRSRYEFLETLGRGTYGKVKLARSKETNEHVAIKTIRKDKVDSQLDMTHIRREMEILSQISHPNIIKIYEVFENQEKIVIVMEYAAGGELYDYISRKRQLNEDETKSLFRQVVSAVRYCHKQGIVHRDLKLENILLDRNNRIKIADFGLSNHFRPDVKLHTFCGSPLYASPEIVNGTPYKGPEVDSWSLGVLLYALTYGSMPFDGSNYSRLSQNISDGKYVQPAVPSNAHDLIDWLLQVDPEKRATIDDVECHRWLEAGVGAAHDGAVGAKETLMIETTPAVAAPVAVTTTTASTPDPYIMTPKSILKHAPAIELTSPSPQRHHHHHHQRRLETPSSEAELEGQLAMVCGLHARDSLKLKNRLHLHSASGVPTTGTNAIAYKRRLLRAKRDRESGYYSSPERLLSSSSSSGGHHQHQAAPTSPSAPMAPADLSQMMHELSVKLTSTPAQHQQQVTYERLAGGDDGSSRSTTPRPHSTYSDSSILSSDSFNLCSFAATPTLESPLNQHHDQQQRPLSMPIMPDQLPTPTPTELEHQPPGTLSPKSEQLLRGLERILMTSSSNRRTSSSSSSSGSYHHHHHRTADPYNHYAAPPPAYIPPFQQQQYPPSYNAYDASSGLVSPITPPVTTTTSYVQYPPPYRHHHYTSLHNQPVYEQPPTVLVQPTIIEESAVVVPTDNAVAGSGAGNGIHADISAQV